jgi:DUF4097 and DUF4098 domain-containing protein YvlB
LEGDKKMKKALIIAVILLVVGGLFVGAGWVLLEQNPPLQNAVKDANYPYGIDNLPTKIDIATLDSRVEILPSTGDEWHVECKDTEKLYHTVELVDGVLTIRQNGTARKWYEYITLQGVKPLSVTVYLPVGTYESLNIHSTSGSIKVREGFTFSNASLQNTSGSITCSSHIAGALDVKNTSGSITVSGGVDGDLHVKNTSGSIDICGEVNGKLEVTNSSGSIKVKEVTPTSVTIKNTSGGIDLYDVVCQGAIKVENTSGSIEFERCDALSFDLRTTSGGIRGSILSAKTFDCRSTSGGVRVPNDGNGGNFLARSGSGGIKIEIVAPSK